jgi:hypothetical protein
MSFLYNWKALFGSSSFLCACIVTASEPRPRGIEIWFAPLTWDVKPSGEGIEYTKYDFPKLLKSDDSWRVAASRIAVISLPGNVAWSYPDLPSLIAFIRRHRFKVAFISGMLFSGGSCGNNVEGISKDDDANRETINIARIWREAGGALDYVVMDSPFYFGHYYAKDCSYSTSEVANRAAATLKGVTYYFPNVKIVDAEGPGAITDDIWLTDMKSWFVSFNRASGYPIDAVALDLHWTDLRKGFTWIRTTRRASREFHSLGIKTGLFINAENRTDITDAEWMGANRQHIIEAASGNLSVDFAFIAEWHGHPQRNLPETDQLGYTSLIDFTYRNWTLRASSLER